jgi:hypothetical protein
MALETGIIVRSETVWTVHDANTWKADVIRTARDLRRLLWEGKQHRVWEFLGYKDWTATIKAIALEAGTSERRLWQLSAANETEQIISTEQCSVGQGVGQIAESVLRPIINLDPDQKRAVWAVATASSPDGKPTAKIVSKAKQQLGLVKLKTVDPEPKPEPMPESIKSHEEVPQLTFECQQCQIYREEIAGLHARIVELEMEVKRRTTNTHPTLPQMEAKIAELRSQAKAAQFFGMKETTFKDWLKKQRQEQRSHHG